MNVWFVGGGGGGGIITSKALVAFSVVDWLSDHMLVGHSQRENAADLQELLVTFLSKMTLYRRHRRATLWCMCATALRAGSRSFRAWSRMTLSFQYGLLVHPKRGCFRCRYRTSSWAAVMASLLLSFPVGVTRPITSQQKNWRDFQQVKVARSTTTSQLPSLTFV